MEAPSNGSGPAPRKAPSRLVELRIIARLALPIALAQVGLTLFGLVDVAVLGRVSATELGGGAIGRSIGFAGLSLGIGAAAALEPLAAQAVGAGELHVAWRSYVGTVRACFVLWLPCVAAVLAAAFLLEPFGVDAALAPPARAFLVAQAPTMLFVPLFLAAKTFLQAHGRTSPALVAAVVANVVNFVACNILVRGQLGSFTSGTTPLGALGAGIASSIASVVLVAVVMIEVWRLRPEGEGHGADAHPVSVWRVLRLGTPIGLQMLAEIGVFSLVAVIAGRLGRVAVSAHHIAIGLASFSFMGVLGVSGATAVRVGLAVGEQRSPRRAGLIGIALGAVFMTCTGMLFVGAPRSLAALFTTDPEILELTVSLLGVAAMFQLFDGIQGVAAGALRGAGDVRFAFLANVVAHWLVGLPLALLLGFTLGMGARGLWFGLLAGLFLVSIALLARFVIVTRRHIDRV